ncbi:MAG: hypothetical protein U0T74_10090 [Chitinophagales bacterium]
MKKVLAILLFISQILPAQVAPLLNGHAHNDYVHTRPLFDALENGFTSIEADVFLHQNELKISHLGLALNQSKTLEELYLKPLYKIVSQNGGSVYKGHITPVILMIDFKTGAGTYEVLKTILKKYEDILTVYKGDSVIHQRAVNILISGNAPYDELKQEDTALVTIDGNLSAMNDTISRKLITRYSSSWSKYFTWKGRGEIPASQKTMLINLVTQAHYLKKEIRFYHIPDKEKVWQTLIDAGVDWINTDKLAAYRKFIEQEHSKTNNRL